MKLVLLSILSLTFTTTAFSQSRGSVSGSIRIGDGTNVVRIGVNDRAGNRNIAKRVKRLERAVRQLQDRVYELEDTAVVVDQELSFNCSVKTCRESHSIHRATRRNCDFFGMYRTEKVRVYSFSGSDAERKALSKINSDSDVKIVKEATLLCEQNR